jgi:hypothetical protein
MFTDLVSRATDVATVPWRRYYFLLLVTNHRPDGEIIRRFSNDHIRPSNPT